MTCTTSQLRPISAAHVPLSLDSGQVRFGGALLKKSKGRRWYGVRAWQKRHIELEENRTGWLETAKPLSTYTRDESSFCTLYAQMY